MTTCRGAAASAARSPREVIPGQLNVVDGLVERAGDLQVLPVAAVGLSSWSELVAAVEEVLGSRQMMHAAVSSGSVSMVILLLDLFTRFGCVFPLPIIWPKEQQVTATKNASLQRRKFPRLEGAVHFLPKP